VKTEQLLFVEAVIKGEFTACGPFADWLQENGRHREAMALQKKYRRWEEECSIKTDEYAQQIRDLMAVGLDPLNYEPLNGHPVDEEETIIILRARTRRYAGRLLTEYVTKNFGANYQPQTKSLRDLTPYELIQALIQSVSHLGADSDSSRLLANEATRRLKRSSSQSKGVRYES
jgi:hypothetical protein